MNYLGKVALHHVAEGWPEPTQRAAWSGALADFLEGLGFWQWGVVFLGCMLPAVACAYWKPFGSDEMFTFEIARQNSAGDVWRALRSGADFHPPLDFLLRHFSMKWFGENELAFRLPSLAAMWISLGCLYSFVARRTSAMYGLIAALIPLSTPVFEFSYEGRGYSLMVALAAGALLAWQRRTDGSRLALVPLAAALAGGVWAHYYGLLVFGPIAVGELKRTRERRRIDWGVCGALVAAAAAVLPLLPFIQAAREFGGTYWTKVGVLQAISIYSGLMERLCICAVAVIVVLLARGLAVRAAADRRARDYEIAAVIGFLLLPIAAYVLAKLATGALVMRYVLPTAVGIVVSLAFIGWETLGASPAAGAVIAGALAVSAFGGEAAFAWKQRQLRAELNQSSISEAVGDLPGPIVMTDNDLLMQLWHYERPEIVKRLVFVADNAAAIEHQGYNTIEALFPRLSPWSRVVNVEPYTEFVRKHRRFVLVDPLRGYVAKLLLRDGAAITARGSYRDNWVFEVNRSGD